MAIFFEPIEQKKEKLKYIDCLKIFVIFFAVYCHIFMNNHRI